MAIDKLYTAKEVALKMGIPRNEVVRRIRRKDIEASKLGDWFWVITEDALEAAMHSDWYLRNHKPQPA